jgi:hypothetical protein
MLTHIEHILLQVILKSNELILDRSHWTSFNLHTY